MSSGVRRVLDAAPGLPVQQVEVAGELPCSLDEAEADLAPAEVEHLWAAEIQRRADRAVRGESTGRDAAVVLAATETKIRNRWSASD